MAGGAEVAYVDILGTEAGGFELGTIGFAEIEVNVFGRRLVTRWLHIEPLEGIGFFAGAGLVEISGGIGELGREFDNKIGSDFIAAWADGRTDGSEKMRRVAAKFELHAANGFLGDAGERAAPASVNGGNGAFLGIDDQDRDAIGGLYGEEKAGAIGSGGVSSAGIHGLLMENADDVRVNLLERDEIEFAGAEGGLQLAAIFQNVFARVPFHEAEVENFFAVEGADAAGAGAEAVNKPGQFRKRSEFENLQAARFAKTPGCGDARGFWRGRRGLARATARPGCFWGSHNQTSIIASG